MSGYQISQYVIVCDSCGRKRGENGEFATAMEARAVVYTEGWRFPAKIKSNGRAADRTSDVCPDCLPTFEPRPAIDRRSS